MTELTLEQLRTFAPGGTRPILAGITEFGPAMLEDFDINTPRRVSHFMAQLAHESAGLRTTTEYASGAAYEGRADLGNVKRGDGRRFRGRGLIQCTGRANYRAFTAWLRQRDSKAPDFEAEPTKLAEFPWALLSAVWYWQTRGLNKLADKDDLRGITRKINGGYNGFVDRQNWFRKAWAIWGADNPVRFAGKPKNPLTSKTNYAAAGLTGLSLAGLSDTTSQTASIWNNLRDIMIDVPWLKFAVLGLVLLAGGYLLYARWRQAQEYDS